MKNYFIGQGTSVIKEFDTLAEMLKYHKTMQPLDRHFCRLYDREKHRTCEGWQAWQAMNKIIPWKIW